MKYGYARIRSEIQDIEPQIEALIIWGINRGNIYIDVSSGMRSERPAFDNLLKKLKPNDSVFVYSIDRISRSVSHFTSLMGYFKAINVDFKSIEEPIIDTLSLEKDHLFTFISTIKQLESNLIKERTYAGLESARRRGRVGGRPKGLSLEAARKARIAEEMYKKSDYSVKEICEFLNIGSKRTLYKYLRYRNVEIGSYIKG